MTGRVYGVASGMSALILGILFTVGAVASASVAWLRGATMAGTVAKGTGIAFTLLALAAFLIG